MSRCFRFETFAVVVMAREDMPRKPRGRSVPAGCPGSTTGSRTSSPSTVPQQSSVRVPWVALVATRTRMPRV